MPTSYPNLAGAYPFLQTCCSVALLPCCSTRDGGSGQVVLGRVFGQWRRNGGEIVGEKGENRGSITAQSSSVQSGGRYSSRTKLCQAGATATARDGC